MNEPAPVVVVGAGLTGAICARSLSAHGVDVVVVDKGRGPGGRLSRRRYASGGFDHGAPCFRPSDPALASLLAEWQEAGVVAPWEAGAGRWQDGHVVRMERPPALVGVPAANALVRHLLDGVDAAFGRRAVQVEDGSVRFDDGEVLEAHAVVITAPTPQARALLGAAGAALEAVTWLPTWSVMVQPVEEPPGLDVGELWVDGHRLVREHTKPGRSAVPRWTLQLSPDESRCRLEDDAEDVAAWAAGWLEARFGVRIGHRAAHRWRYSGVDRALGVPFLTVGTTLVAGDGVLGGGVEAALRSGLAAAEAILATAPPRRRSSTAGTPASRRCC